jgi:hypothetical protein
MNFGQNTLQVVEIKLLNHKILWSAFVRLGGQLGMEIARDALRGVDEPGVYSRTCSLASA